MANAHRGDVTVDAAGVRYTLRFSTNALCDLEDETGEPAAKTFAALQSEAGVTFRRLRLLFWVGLKQHHPEVTLEEAGRIIDDCGGIAVATDALGQAIVAAFPVAEAAAGGAAGPRKARGPQAA